MEVTNIATVTKHYEKCLNMLLHVVLLYFGGHMIRANHIKNKQRDVYNHKMKVLFGLIVLVKKR